LAYNFADVNMIPIYVLIGTVLSPCCYGCQKMNE
jgi:hypothetical protein